MKKYLFLALVASCSMAFASCMAPMPATGVQQQAQQPAAQQTQQTAQDPLNGLLGGIVGAASEKSEGLGGVLGNILSSVTGSLTTTQANLIDTWTYTEPAVQFESENLLTQAGGAASATKIEAKLAGMYKLVGISEGKLQFTFAKDGKMSYSIGGRAFEGTYVFDAKNKTVTLTTATGMNLTSYVTISGQNMSLCFDSTKLLTLVSAFGGNAQTTLGAIGTMAQSYSGMKTGFKFKK